MASLSLTNVCKVYPNGFEAVKDSGYSFFASSSDSLLFSFFGFSVSTDKSTLQFGRLLAVLQSVTTLQEENLHLFLFFVPDWVWLTVV